MLIDMARALEPSHVTVDLLITLSPFMQKIVSPQMSSKRSITIRRPDGGSRWKRSLAFTAS